MPKFHFVQFVSVCINIVITSKILLLKRNKTFFYFETVCDNQNV